MHVCCPAAQGCSVGADRSGAVQEIAAGEAEITKKQVQRTSNRKSAAKLQKDAAKAEEQLDQTKQRISAQEKALTVSLRCCWHALQNDCQPGAL